jgi:Tol biopolymer transport system component
MASQTTTDDRLDGWDAISDYLGWHARTVIRWEKQKGLPVHRVSGGKRQPVYAYRHEIDRWFQKTGGAGPKATSAPAVFEPEVASQSPTVPVPTRRISRLAIHAVAAATILSVSALGTAWRLSTQPVIQITGVTQLTDDGTAKRNLVTDGKQLYFSENVGDKEVLSDMAVSGGRIRRMPLPLPNPYPEDISPDGKFLLVLSAVGIEDEHPLWIVPTAGGLPHQMTGVKCRTAAWSPNGEWIAFGHGDAIYLVSPDGVHSRQLSRVDGIPQTLQWSADGKHLLFFLRNLPIGATSLWQMDIDGNLNAERVVPLHTAGEKCCRGELLTRDANAYFSITNDSTTDHLLYLRPRPWWRARLLEASALITHFEAIEGLAADANARRLFVLSGARQQGELVRYDLSVRSFTMMLPGASATFVDLAKSVGLVTYVKSQDGTLWVSRVDGSDATQVSPAGMEVELPRWSPDGKWIAFMGKQPDRPFRIFVIPAAGGVPKEASNNGDNQGAPTWSPDGRFLLYGNVLCQEERTCAIHKIDLASGKITTLPESQGLATARWSPNGRHVAALNPVQHELYVFDLDSQRWRKLADGINGNDVSWSSDSQYIYTKSSMNGQTEILRVAVGGGSVQTVLNLNSFSKSAGQLDTWFSLTPDNTLILNRWLNTSEIYALSYKEQ